MYGDEPTATPRAPLSRWGVGHLEPRFSATGLGGGGGELATAMNASGVLLKLKTDDTRPKLWGRVLVTFPISVLGVTCRATHRLRDFGMAMSPYHLKSPIYIWNKNMVLYSP